MTMATSDEQQLTGAVSKSPATMAETNSPRIAFMMSRFPKITETFILYEMVETENSGVSCEVFPLRREKTLVMHPEAVAFTKRAHFLPLMSREILCDSVAALRCRPILFLKTLRELILANFRCPRLLRGALAMFPMCVTMARRMQELQIDHIHAHFASHPAAAAWIIHQFTGIPYSFVAHGSDLHRNQNMLREKVRDAAFVVPISEYNRRIILDKAGEQQADKVHVIHCGVKPDDFDTGYRLSQDNKPSRRCKIFCIGTLHEVKGQRYLIDATARAVANGSDLEVHFIGDGPDQPLLEGRVANAGLMNRVVFHGRRTRQEVVQLLQTADMLAAPSVPTSNGRREGIPIVLMEAMASGVPVIASRLSGIPELVVDQINGLLAEPGDVAGLTAAIETLCRDPALRNRLGTAGRRTIETDFNMEISVRTLLDTIRESLEVTHRDREQDHFECQRPQERVLRSAHD